MGNPQPVFSSKGVVVRGKRLVGRGKDHLKLTLEDEGVVFDAIGFRMGSRYEALPDRVEVAYRLQLNDYWDIPTLELTLVDIRPEGSFSDPDLTIVRSNPNQQSDT
jgi:single-stranded-DNA-specific exonuclease